jgi:hypothetical protein
MGPKQVWLWAALLTLLASLPLPAQTTTIYSENWDSYTSYSATNLADTTYAFPTGAAPALVVGALGNNPAGGTAGSGVQLINWLAHSGTQSLLVRSGCEADVNLYQARSGSRYQLDFWLYVHKQGPTGTAGTKNFYIRPGGMGSDNNGDDYIAYRSDRTQGSYKVYNYNGISGGAWTYVGASTIEDTWQHHRLSVDTTSRIVTVFIDDMSNAVFSGYIARPDVAVPTLFRIENEGSTTNDGYFAIDDVAITVDNAVASLSTPFTEGFENYAVGTNPVAGPWITVACNGTGIGAALNPSKVQVVDTSTITPHSGTKCLMLQGGERGGVSLAWGVPPLGDVQITWWANVPAVIFDGLSHVFLNMSLYNTEGGNAFGGNSTELGYGLMEQSGTAVGGLDSLLYYTSLWVDTTNTYTPGTWEEYQLTTYNLEGTYSLVKNPGSANAVALVTHAPFIMVGSPSGPTLMASWASSTGSTAPAYIDDIAVQSVTNAPYGPPAPHPSGPYTATILSNNPAAYYACQESPGSVILYDTSSSGSHNGKWGYDTSGNYPEMGQPGIGGNSVLFHAYSGAGGNPYATAGYYADLNPVGPFAVDCWVRAISAPSSGYRAPVGNFNVNFGWIFYQGPYIGNGEFNWIWVQEDGGIWITSAPATPNEWYHLAASSDGTTVSFYVNGQYQGQANAAAAAPNNKPLLIGTDSTSSSSPAFDGNICQLALYNHTLTASQIQTHYQVGITNIEIGTNAPSITTEPIATSAESGNPVTFQVAVQGSTPLSYQWYRNNARIAGATSSTLQFTCAYTDNGATYMAVITNRYGSATSSPTTLTVLTDLFLTNSPVSVTRSVGSKAAFLADGGGALPISYQWFKNSSPIPGGTNQTLWLNNVQLTDDGSTYYAQLTNGFGAITNSLPATLSVAPRITTVPLTRYASVVAADDPVAYWRFDEADASSPAVDAIGSFDGTYDDHTGAGTLTFGVATGIPYETNVAVAVTGGAEVSVPYALELNPYGPFSAEVWVQPTSLLASSAGTDRTAFGSMGEGVGGPIGWNLIQTDTSLWTLIMWGDNWNNTSITDTSDIIVTNNWYHLVVTYDGSLFNLYVNGALRAAGPYSGYVPNYNGATVFGWLSNKDYQPFTGAIDDAAFYNKALTSDQVRTHYLATIRLTVTKLGNTVVLSWPAGTLQHASTVNGLYTDMNSTTSPYTNSPTAAPSFFRVKVY